MIKAVLNVTWNSSQGVGPTIGRPASCCQPWSQVGSSTAAINKESERHRPNVPQRQQPAERAAVWPWLVRNAPARFGCVDLALHFP